MTQIVEHSDILHPNILDRPHPRELANEAVRRFVHRVLRLCRPDRIYWCNGSGYELDRLTEQAVRDGVLEQPDSEQGAPTSATCAQVEPLFKDCMIGRTMYVVPFITGPTASAPAEIGVQITDSLRTALTLAQTARIGDVALRAMGPNDTSFRRGVHSAGDGIAGRHYVCDDPFENTVWSFGTTNP